MGKGTYPNLIMAIYNKPTANIIQNGEKEFSIKRGVGQNVHTPSSCSVWYLKSKVIRQVKEIKGIQTAEEKVKVFLI